MAGTVTGNVLFPVYRLGNYKINRSAETCVLPLLPAGSGCVSSIAPGPQSVCRVFVELINE